MLVFAIMKYSAVFVLGVYIVQYFGTSANIRSSKDIARSVSRKIVQEKFFFFKWNYGGALVFDGIFQANQTFGIENSSILNTYLDEYKQNPREYGYRIIHKIPIPWDSAVGDGIGLFPIAYLNRLLLKSDNENIGKYFQDSKTDYQIISTVANDFILKWPRRLSDGTFSRNDSWPGQKDYNASFVWGDDQFMGLTLLSRLAYHFNDSKYALEVGRQAINLAGHMRDPADNLFFHGTNVYNNTNHWSCCKWGRANGWGMMSHVEALQALSHFKTPQVQELFGKVLSIFQSHSMAMKKYQNQTDGRWHQVVDVASTYLETSSTAMSLSSMARGIMGGWLEYTSYADTVHMAWKGLTSAIAEDGTVNGICVGTGIKTSVEAYEDRPTLYLLSRDGGLGAVLYAAVDYDKFLHYEKNLKN